MRRIAVMLAAGVFPVVVTVVAAAACSSDGATPPRVGTSVTVLIDDPDGEIPVPAPPLVRATSVGGGVGGG